MATGNFNRQFIMLDFEDLDNPEFMEFVRSPEFSTYLIMRRYVWRSKKTHSLGLHEYYASGLLASALSRGKLAKSLGGVSSRQMTRDINALLKRQVIKSVVTGRGNVFILGRWAVDKEDQVYYEYFFLDRLQKRVDENVQSERTAQEGGQKRPPSLDTTVDSDSPIVSSNNKESNRELNRGYSNLPSTPFRPTDHSKGEEKEDILESPELEMLIETCSREFNDVNHLQSNWSRAFNLWAETDLDGETMLERALEAFELGHKAASGKILIYTDKTNIPK